MLKETSKQELIGDLQRRVQDKILEPTNFEFGTMSRKSTN